MLEAHVKIVEGKALTAPQKKDLLNRLARIEGQLRGVQKLIALADTPVDCDAVAQQMAAQQQIAQMRRALPPGQGAGPPGHPGQPGDPAQPGEQNPGTQHGTGQYL